MLLRPYQERAISELRAAVRAGSRAPLLVLPTGAGKTVVATAIVSSHVATPGRRVLFVVHRKELLDQAARTLRAAGLTVRTIRAADTDGPADAQVTVAMVQTLAGKRWRDRLPLATLVVFDEAHHLRAESWETIASFYSSALVIGLTATPERSDGKPLGGVFDHIVVGSTISELTELTHLVPCAVYGPPERGKHLAADPVDIYVEHGQGRQCVVFCTNVVHAQDVASRLLQRGVQAVCVDGKLDAQERAARLQRFHCRDAAVVTNVAVLTEGWDEPAVELCILARGAEHCGLYLQMVGRILRPYPGKTRAELWDLRGVTHQHGMPDDERVYSLEGDAISNASKLPPIQQCRFCGAVYRPTPICPQCGKPSPMPEPPEVRAQRLALLAANDSPDRRDEYWQRLQAIAAERGYNRGWAAHRYHAKYGEWRAA